MSAREELFRRVVGAFVSEDRANKLIDAHRAEVIAERDSQVILWLGKKAVEFGSSNRESRAMAEALRCMADKLSRGAVRDDETGVSELYRLRAENNQLRHDITGACLARYEEEQENERLLKERHSTNEALDDAVREAATLRARVAELEALLPYREVWSDELPPGGFVCNVCGQPVESEPCPDHEPKPQRQAEDPHASPLHHDYALGRDLPAIPHQQDRRAS
ncbi:hypothetical protein [Streptomyces sp. NPDC056544]|uniref:hypothetical protein n=1 Tax=Streptomyces sp. NPDC056544 TaxID=3345863 RepID=UPI0036A539A5